MKAINSQYCWRDHKFPLYDSTYNLLVQILTLLANPSFPVSAFEKLAPIKCNNPDVQKEKRKHEWVRFYISAFNSNYDVTKIPLPSDCDYLDTEVTLEIPEP